jgi:transcriptional regulator with XRE-family HTH domain
MSSKSKPTTTALKTDDVTEARIRAGVGRRVREARERAGLTGRRLAALAECTPGFISQIELGQVTPSLLSLVKITNALGIHMADLFDAKPPPVGEVISKEDWSVFQYPDGSFEDAVLAIDPDGTFEVVWSRIEPEYRGAETETTAPGSKIVFVFVLRGEVELRLGGESHILREQGSILLPCDVPRYWTNSSSAPAEILTVIAPATY